MSGIHDDEKIDDLRERLYARGNDLRKRRLSQLTDATQAHVTHTWQEPPHPKEPPPPPPPENPMVTSRRKKYRLKILLAGFLFFVLAVGASSAFLFYGNKGISAENIVLAINGPFTIGGGETLSLQVGLTNQNAVPIKSAMLIVEYPDGTKSAGEDRKDLFIERLPLDEVMSGETLNIPLRAVVFGEENDEQLVKVAIEYRVEGSNATFFKEAEPLRFKISSAPVVVRAVANKRVSSGQETDITLTITSNSQSTLTNLLVEAEYPEQFDFIIAEPDTDSGENRWQIDSLEPGEERKITITGVVVGRETDELAMHFSVGVPSERNQNEMASIFSTAITELTIEQPFIDVSLALAGESDGSVTVESGQSVSGVITVTNKLSDTLYDTKIEAVLAGNAVDDRQVRETGGFYDSITNTITWQPADLERLRELGPGESLDVNFSLIPDASVSRTPEVNVTIDVTTRRVSENRVPEELRGSVSGVVRISSRTSLLSEARRVSGPIPPAAEQTTTYTLSLLIANGSNSLDNAEVTATLPSYVTWEGAGSGVGDFSFNDSTRTVTWVVDEVDANENAVGSFTVSITPSVTQIDTTPTLLGDQRLRASDAFTGETVRATKAAVTTELSTELGFPPGNGRVTE